MIATDYIFGRKPGANVLPTLYNGLLAGFHLDETSGLPFDFVGNLGINPTLNSVTQGVTGKFDKAIQIEIGQVSLNTNSLIGGLSAFTIAAWTRWNGISNTTNNICSSLGGNRMYAFSRDATNAAFIYLVGNVSYGGSFSGLPSDTLDTNWALSILEWDGTTIRYIRNNVTSPDTFATPIGTIQKGTSEVIGGGWRSFQRSHQDIDEVLYWNRPLITTEKAALWNNGIGIKL